ncbi:hypothetical protein JY651_42930 [Pyxidicoccus parkwayensis]|uniref:GIY-YIG domain-containing protein n=1 Tax=Pyxidicoccus parkwayensis TaxID=2813578 RepID=A0ABX7NSH5_9BACT|nr:hypothetical protein [Pyxidicoccus parkwaysis]QSQ21836.1 hypothetical protein JY651_42930 [Pyxidicoccus parkwaysis]
MRNTAIQDLEVYIGRASTVGRTMKRWKEHSENRGHTWASVLFQASRAHAKVLEKAAIRTIQRLKTQKTLCIGNANIVGGANGPDTDVEHEFVYMTWGWRTEWSDFEGKPSIDDLREIAHVVALDMKGAVTEQQLRNGLEVAKAPLSQFERLEWYNPE